MVTVTLSYLQQLDTTTRSGSGKRTVEYAIELFNIQILYPSSVSFLITVNVSLWSAPLVLVSVFWIFFQ